MFSTSAQQEELRTSRTSRFSFRPQLYLCRPKGNITSTNPLSATSSIRLNKGTHPDNDLQDPLGLTILHQPTTPSVDIVFVHGLGGKSKKSWAKDKKPELFWPEWLPTEEGMQGARISTFGYDADFMVRGPRHGWTIADFAEDLLYETGLDADDARPKIRKRPVIFVAHSMGGIVVKKACILATSISQLQRNGITRPNTAIMFLSTPHQGSHLANLLHLILGLSFLGDLSKPYVSELKQNSKTLIHINSQFLTMVPLPTVASFYESMRTSIGPVKKRILDEKLATFGYPDEIVRKLEADHHNVCKYSGTEDQNYIIVLDVLRNLVDQLKVEDARLLEYEKLGQIQKLLGIPESPENDRAEFFRYYMPDSCQAFVSCRAFQNWLCNTTKTPQLVWVHGPPGVGKSVLSSYIIQHLDELELKCHYYYFRFGDQEKGSIGTFIRSLAYQVAKDDPDFRDQLALLLSAQDFIHSDNESDAWEAMFVQQFLDVTFSKPLYWIVDGIDECNSPHLLLKMMTTLSGCNSPLRIMFFSRFNNKLSTSFKALSLSMELTEISFEADQNDLSMFVRDKLEHRQAVPELCDSVERIREKILGAAKGSFLWTRFAVESILQCKERFEVEAALMKLNPQIEPFYQRMEEALMRTLSSVDFELAKLILTWTICSRRQLTIGELLAAVQPQRNSRSKFVSDISRVCASFVAVDSHTSRVTIVNNSAKAYLTDHGGAFRIGLIESHRILFHKCLSVLCQVRSNFPDQDLALDSLLKTNALLRYATSSWFYHLSKIAHVFDEESLQLLATFLNEFHVLTWISIVASMPKLRLIVEAVEILRSSSKHQQDHGQVIQRWATDLLQITTKFGDQLVGHPRTIYSLVPAFCPPISALYKSVFTIYSGSGAAPSVRVTGDSHNDWTEYLARFKVGKNCNASKILCTDSHFAISTAPLNGFAADGIVHVYQSRTCEEVAVLTQEEATLNMQFSASGRLFATCGIRHIKIWMTPTDLSGAFQPFCTLENPDASRLLALAFSADDQTLIIYSPDGHVRRAYLSSIETGWFTVGVALDGIGIPRMIGPSCAAFNLDASSIAIGFRGAPVAVWKLAPFGPLQRHQRKNRSSTNVSTIEWNHESGHVIGLYDDGCVFKWQPSVVDTEKEFPAGAINIKCNMKGNVLTTSSGDSSLTIWDFERCSPLYELSLPTSVTDLAISPDGRSIYELRESSCTVWQPTTLNSGSSTLRALPNNTGRSSPDERVNKKPKDKKPKDITALAVGQKTSSCCIGDMDGVLQIISVDGRRISAQPSFKAPIEHIAWSLDEKYLATANVANQILVRRVDLAAIDAARTSNSNMGHILEARLDASVQQLIFDKSSKFVFAATERSLFLWELEERPRLVVQRTINKQYRWINHPGNHQMLLGFAFDTLKALRWQDLEQEFELGIKPPPSSSLGIPSSHDITEAYVGASLESTPSVKRVLLSCDGSLAFIQVAAPFIITRKVHDEFFILYTMGIGNPDCDVRPHPRLVPLPRHLQALIHVPIGFVDARTYSPAISSPPPTIEMDDSHLVFLSNEGWVCTMYVGGKDLLNRVKNHYFLPRDWLVIDALELAEVTVTGTLFCPQNGEVGIISNGLGKGWTG